MKGKKFLAFSLTAAMLAGSALTVSAAGVSDVFNAGYYADKYGDLKATYGTDEAALLQHFMTSGAKEGRVMSPILDVAAYRKAYADLNAAYGDDWDAYVDHYLAFGIREGRKEGVLFDLADYAAKNPDVKAVYGEDYSAIAKHYVTFGIKEGRPGGAIVKAAAPAASAGGSSSGSTTTPGGSDTTTKPETPPVVQYGHEHDWDTWISDFDKYGTKLREVERERPTCTHAGYVNYRCTEMVTCITYGDGTALWVPTTEYNANVASGMYNKKGTSIKNVTHSQCSATSGRREIPQLHHTVPRDGAYIVDHPTCTEAGVATYVCETCGTYVEKEAIPALTHDWAPTKTVTATGCSEATKGYTEEVCQRSGCGAKRQTNVVYKHAVADYAVVTAPKCNAEGWEVGYCSICKTEVGRKIAMTGHVYEYKDAAGNKHSTKGVSIPVDTYVKVVKDGKDVNVAAHATYTVDYCVDCKLITYVSNDTTNLVRTACTDTDGDGLCNGCNRPVGRHLINSEKLYKVTEYFQGTNIQ